MENEVNDNFGTEKKKGNFVKYLKIIALVVIVIAGFMYYQVNKLENNSPQVNREEVLKLVEKVDKIIDLPDGEVPTLAVVSDLEALKGQPFFEKAKIGHQVLMYPVAKKAYLYDPEKNMIVEVGSMLLGR